MGRIEYAAISLPNLLYFDDACESLGALFHIGMNECGADGQGLADAFLASGLAREFERCSPVFLCGKSALELLETMRPLLGGLSLPKAARVLPSPEYWVGWMLAYFQLKTGRPYGRILGAVSFDELLSLYHPLHEAPEEKFIEVLSKRLNSEGATTNLQRQRKLCGLSQSQLAKRSGVGLRSIQLYEQGQKDINHASAETLYRLAQSLHCTMEALMQL